MIGFDQKNDVEIYDEYSSGEDATQEVPDLCSLVSSDGGEEGKDVSVGLNVEEMLQDVAVMQREIDQLEENMSEPW